MNTKNRVWQYVFFLIGLELAVICIVASSYSLILFQTKLTNNKYNIKFNSLKNYNRTTTIVSLQNIHDILHENNNDHSNVKFSSHTNSNNITTLMSKNKQQKFDATHNNNAKMVDSHNIKNNLLLRSCKEKPQDTFRITTSISDIIMASKDHNNRLITKRKQPRKLILGMTFDCEEWMLEIKLNELGNIVDHFIIVEGLFTFQNSKREQPCFQRIMDSNEHISKWKDKIVYVYDTEPIPNFQYWEAEVHYRNAIGIKGLANIMETSDDDLIIITDMDEFLHENFLYMLKWHDGFKTAIKISLLWSYYSFKWINAKPWTPNAIVSLRELKLVANQTNRIRFDAAGQEIWEISDMIVGWHCSWCLPTTAFIDKLAHFSHSELNRDNFKNIQWLDSMRDSGLWFPDSGPNGCIQTQIQLPLYVQMNMPKFEKIWK